MSYLLFFLSTQLLYINKIIIENEITDYLLIIFYN